MQNYADLLLINEVRDLQDEVGTGETYANVYPTRTKDSLDESEIEFISTRKSFT